MLILMFIHYYYAQNHYVYMVNYYVLSGLSTITYYFMRDAIIIFQTIHYILISTIAGYIHATDAIMLH